MDKPLSTPRMLACAAALAAIASAGCLMQQSFAANVTTADGVTLEVPLGQSKLEVTDGPVEVSRFQFVPELLEDKSRGIVMTFAVDFKDGTKPASIVVEDVTEAPIMAVFTDLSPKMFKPGRWLGVTTVSRPTDARLSWMMTLDNSVRVYRFTVVLVNGPTHVLRVPVFVPAEMKSFIRTQLKV